MKRGLKLLGIFIEILSRCLCLISITTPLAITIVSVLGVIEKTQKQNFWRIAFLTIYLGLIIISICFAGEYALISLGKKTTLLLFSVK